MLWEKNNEKSFSRQKNKDQNSHTDKESSERSRFGCVGLGKIYVPLLITTEHILRNVIVMTFKAKKG